VARDQLHQVAAAEKAKKKKEEKKEEGQIGILFFSFVEWSAVDVLSFDDGCSSSVLDHFTLICLLAINWERTNKLSGRKNRQQTRGQRGREGHTLLAWDTTHIRAMAEGPTAVATENEVAATSEASSAPTAASVAAAAPSSSISYAKIAAVHQVS
jgi:hypothetical protein